MIGLLIGITHPLNHSFLELLSIPSLHLLFIISQGHFPKKLIISQLPLSSLPLYAPCHHSYQHAPSHHTLTLRPLLWPFVSSDLHSAPRKTSYPRDLDSQVTSTRHSPKKGSSHGVTFDRMVAKVLSEEHQSHGSGDDGN